MTLKTLLLLTLFSINAFSQDDFFRPWPSELNSKTPFYRGQATNLTSFKTMLDMLITPNDNSIVTSRLMRTLMKMHPNKSLKQLVPIVDKLVLEWKKNSVLWKITECHVAVYGCSMPTVKELMGDYFKFQDLPELIQAAYSRQQAGKRDYLSLADMEQVLSFFDPVVSTSYYKEVADNFAKDKEGGVGYTMKLNDKLHRNCSKESKKEVDCFISLEEYMDEYEMPFWGYVTHEEFDGFHVGDISIQKIDAHIILQQGKIYNVLNKKNACDNKVQFITKRQIALNFELQKYFNCH